MSTRLIKRLPEVKTLWDILPKGAEGGKEFARIVDLLRFQEGRRSGTNITLFSDIAGDYQGLDGLEKSTKGNIGYQYKFYPSPLSASHRSEIEQSLVNTKKKQKTLKLKKWILVTPQDLTESSTRKDGGDVTWFESLKAKYSLRFKLEHWGHRSLQSLFLQSQILCLYYFPELADEGQTRQRTIQDLRSRFNAALEELYQEIHFVGVAVHEQKTTQGIPMKDIYIPLDVLPEGISDESARRNSSQLLSQGSRTVVLGDPGSGKSTLLKFLALAGTSVELQSRYGVAPDPRLPILLILRRYAHELTTRLNLGLREYIIETMKAALSLPVDDAFLDYYLESGQAILLFDGMDELPDSNLRKDIRDRINTFMATYPHNTVIVSSRFVGYDGPYRFKKESFAHYQVASLRLPEMERFVKDWYTARIPNASERKKNVSDLITTLQDPNHQSIRDLAANPLLLTIIALVHRIEADLPDERVLLYRKCTETLLSTWNNYKGADIGDKKPGRAERRNLYRIEAVAHWMQTSGSRKGRERAVVKYSDLRRFLTDYISKTPNEPKDQDHEADQLADLFLNFIRERAGLLIEAGANLYCFVHLTFQEYLAAEYIKRQAGFGGVDFVWKQIQLHLSDPRWHEVLRLLIAGYEQPEAEAVLIGRILELKQPHSCVVELLGGLLVDGVVAAEERQQDILPLLISTCQTADSDSSFSTMLDLLKAWSVRTENRTPLFESASAGIGSESCALLSQLLGLGTDLDSSRLKFFLGGSMKPEDDASARKLQEQARQFDYWALNSESGSLRSAILHAFFSHDSINGLKHSFSHLLFLCPNLRFSIDFHLFTSWLAGDCFLSHLQDLSLHLGEKLDLGLVPDPALALALARDRALYRALAQDRDLYRALDRARDRSLALARARARARAVARIRDWRLEQDLARATSWNEILNTPELFDPYLSDLVAGFELGPPLLWKEFLRTRVLPSLPRRAKLHDDQLWARSTKRMRSSSSGELDQWLAARHLLVEADFVAFGVFDAKAANPLTELAELTRSSEFPAIRVAHAIRDISYQRPGGVENLRKLLRSNDRAIQSIFRDAYWID